MRISTSGMGAKWICLLPKIYMNASQHEEVKKTGAREVKGMPRRSRKWRFLPLAGRLKRGRIDMEMMFAEASARDRLIVSLFADTNKLRV